MLSASRRRGRAAAAAAALLASLAAAASAQTADHRRFAALKGPFQDARAVSRACRTCHNEAEAQLEKTTHWTWAAAEKIPGHPGITRLGKRNAVNNFCIGIQGNEASCTKCHIGFGRPDKHFDFSKHDAADCLVCHDGTGDYVKAGGEGGGGGEPVDYARLAQGVGPTSLRTCGSCHFNGGGGEGVKHGDLDASLLDATKALDVHMAKDGMGFTCSTCHRGDEVGHAIKGRLTSVSVSSAGFVTCAQCHGSAPHGMDFIFRSDRERISSAHFAPGPERLSPWQSLRRNWHARRIACQTCHIPEFARGEPTKMWWDWSTAGRHHPDGRPVIEFAEDGTMSYWGIKGSFRWQKDVVPAYRWWDGRSGRYLLGDRFDPSRVLVLNPPLGGPGDPAAKIWPFKIHSGRQPFDPVNKMLIQPYLAGKKGSGAFWGDYDWVTASRIGMKGAGLPFSGKVAFARTDMYWPVTHMVAQGARGLSCADCHSRDSRLAGVPGVYLPGYSRSRALDFLGWLSAVLCLLGVLLHGALRWLGGRGHLERILSRIRRMR